MSHDVEKRYYECLAKNLLETFLPEKFFDLTLKDKPDIHSSSGIGIEVTRALFKDQEKINNYFEKYLSGKKKSEIDQKLIDNFSTKDTQLICINDKIVGYCPPAIWLTIDELKQAYIKKKQKLYTYNWSGKLHLFIFTPLFNDYENDDIEKFMTWICEEERSDKEYDIVYIYQENIMYICNIPMNTVETLVLDKEKIHMCCVNAKDYALPSKE